MLLVVLHEPQTERGDGEAHAIVGFVQHGHKLGSDFVHLDHVRELAQQAELSVGVCLCVVRV